MGLQAWYPLINDMHNQGVGDTDLAVETTPTFGAGKMGNALISGGNSHWTATQSEKVLNNKAISICFWVYVDAPEGDTNKRAMFFGNNGKRNYSLFQYPSCNDFHWSWSSYDSSSTQTYVTGGVLYGALPSYEWTHVAITYSNPNGAIYINGEKKQTFSGVMNNYTFSNQTPVIYQCQYRKLNDFRIYDHALSPREVKEISKGLVLHYPLAMPGNENLHKNSSTLLTRWTISQGTITHGVATITPTTDDGRRLYQLPVDGGWSWIANTDYTASIEARSDNGATLVIAPYGANTTYKQFNVTTEWKRYSYSFTSGSSVSTGSISYLINQISGTSLQLRYPKLELGSIATPWIPNPADTAYTALGFNDGIEYDVSGFERNGTKSNMAYSSDTARYHTSSVFNKQTSRILIPNIWNTSVKNPEITFSFWMKRDDYDDSYPHYMYNDICSIYMYPNDQYAGNGYGLRITWKHDTASSSHTNTWATGRTIPADEWHHVCFTTKEGVMKLYIDGVISVINDRSSTGQYIGSYNYGALGYVYDNGGVLSYGGELSDFRIYATALSADDILELYHTSASLADNGTLMAYEFNDG